MMRVAEIASALLCLTMLGCVTSPLGRKQLMLVDDQQMDQMGVAAFQEMKTQTPIESDATVNRYVTCVAQPITQAARGQTPVSNWEIVVFKDPTANAFALPGGKIGVHTGLLTVAKNQDQLAAVLGHEVGHVIARHSAERMSEAQMQGVGLSAINAFITHGAAPSGSSQMIMAALGLGAQVGVALPHSRTQESEADLIGENLMAKAGFDPRQSVELWHNMSAASGGAAPPEFLSTHPASEKRIAELQKNLPQALPIYEQARASGLNPRCVR